MCEVLHTALVPDPLPSLSSVCKKGWLAASARTKASCIRVLQVCYAKQQRVASVLHAEGILCCAEDVLRIAVLACLLPAAGVQAA